MASRRQHEHIVGQLIKLRPIGNRPAGWRSRECGQAVFFVMLAMIPLCLVLGLVVDVGMAYYTKAEAQTAAQTAALAAVQKAMDGIYQGGTYTCGSQSLGCESSLTACTAIPSTGNLPSACQYANSNGFANANVLIQAGTGDPHSAGVTNSSYNVNYWVRVQITQPNRLTFGVFSGLQSLNVQASAIAAAANMIPLSCVVALDPTANPALNLNGNVTLKTVGCGVTVDSSSSSALSVTGNITLNAPSIGILGGCSGCGGGNVHVTCTGGGIPCPATLPSRALDPLEGVPAPRVASGCGSSQSTTPLSINHSPSAPLQPGIYYGGISVTGNASVNFSAGTYCFVGGGLSATGNTTLTGSGVTFYNTFDGQHPFAPISVAGNVTLQLSAPSSGSLEDMLFFEDRNAPSGKTNIITGNSSMDIKGAIYFPKSGLTIDGNASDQQLMIVADTISTSGNATNLTIDPQAGATPVTPQISAALIQ